MKECLFIGGDSDGKRIFVDDRLPEYRMPIKDNPDYSGNGTGKCAAVLVVQSYRRIVLRDEDETDYIVYSGGNPMQTVRQLIDNYPTSSCTSAPRDVDSTSNAEHTAQSGCKAGSRCQNTPDSRGAWLIYCDGCKHDSMTSTPLKDNLKPYSIDALLSELAAAEQQRDKLLIAAQAVIDRWETPLWKDAPATAEFIYALRDEVASIQGDK